MKKTFIFYLYYKIRFKRFVLLTLIKRERVRVHAIIACLGERLREIFGYTRLKSNDVVPIVTRRGRNLTPSTSLLHLSASPLTVTKHDFANQNPPESKFRADSNN